MSSVKNLSFKFMGLDLAAKIMHPTGWAVIDERATICMEPGEVFSDYEILDKVKMIQPEWIGIDAPLSFPRNKMRSCDKQLRKFGSPALPPVLIASLTRRGMKLYQVLTKKGYKCIEVYPRATQKILGIKTEGKKTAMQWRVSCQEGISRWVGGLSLPKRKVYSSHILDAILCAYTAYCRWKGTYMEVGDEEGKIVVPC